MLVRLTPPWWCLAALACADTEEALVSDVFVDVAITSSQECGLRETGEVDCWHGERHFFDTYTELAASETVMCALRAPDTRGVPLQCSTAPGAHTWLSHSAHRLEMGPLGHSWCALEADGVVCSDGSWALGHPGLVDLTVGADGVCAWDDEGVVHCSGEPPPLPEHVRVRDMTLRFGACVVRRDGVLQCFDDTRQHTPPLGDFDRIWSSRRRHCARTTEGQLRCWATAWDVETPAGTWSELSLFRDWGCGLQSGSPHCWLL
ncbi:MAG: hypothetical protein KTR31_11120 [Myxococcales bacterium]|nr:hypothetical protein [Myxococcales bacterium]